VQTMICSAEYRLLSLRRYANVLQRCARDGSDLRQPFDCPIDAFLSPAALEAAVPHRLPGFLEDSRVGAMA
jgi:hypothetical protein